MVQQVLNRCCLLTIQGKMFFEEKKTGSVWIGRKRGAPRARILKRRELARKPLLAGAKSGRAAAAVFKRICQHCCLEELVRDISRRISSLMCTLDLYTYL